MITSERPRQGDGLRHRPGDRRHRRDDDADPVGRRHRAVPLARAGPGPDRRRALRPLLDRVPPLRAARRPAAVHRRLSGRDRLPARRRAAAAAERLQRLPSAATSTPSRCTPSPRTARRATRTPTAFRDDLENVRLGRQISAAALGTAAAVGAAATQTLPQSYAAPGTPTAVQPPVTSRRERYENTAGLPAVGHDEGDDDGKGGKGKAALVTALVIAVLALVGWGAVTWFGNQTPAVTTVAVPTIEGMKEDVAARTLATNNLRGEKSPAASTDGAGGRGRQPGPRVRAPGSPSSRSIKYVVSTGPDSLTVPDITGFDKDTARAGAREAGLRRGGLPGGEHARPGQGQGDEDRARQPRPSSPRARRSGSSTPRGNVKVPDNLVGQDWALAAVALQNAGPRAAQGDRRVRQEPRRGAVGRARPATSSRSAPTIRSSRWRGPRARRRPSRSRRPPPTARRRPTRPTTPPPTAWSAPGIRRRALAERQRPSSVSVPAVRRVEVDSDGGGDERAQPDRPLRRRRCRRTARGSSRASGGRPRSARSRGGTARRAAGRSRWRTAMTSPESVCPVATSSSGRVAGSIVSEW